MNMNVGKEIKTVGDLVDFLSHFDKNGAVTLCATGEWPYCTAKIEVNDETVARQGDDMPIVVADFCTTLTNYNE